MTPSSIAALNRLSAAEKRRTYCRFIPQELRSQFKIPADFQDEAGNDLLSLIARPGSADVRVDLRHEFGARDPLLFAHLTDTVNGQIHVLLYVVNDPRSPRFDVDVMPDGTPTEFGVFRRNLAAEQAAMAAGLAPGQVRRGLRLLSHSITAFEHFVVHLGHDLFFVEPLAYHNAVVFERYGFFYAKGRRLMQQIEAGFQPDGDLNRALDASTPFRLPGMEQRIRGRSWAIHDGILGHPYSGVTMYKRVGVESQINTFPKAKW